MPTGWPPNSTARRSPGSSTTPDRGGPGAQPPLWLQTPDHRPGLHETFNRDNVTLVDLRSDPIRAVTTTGIDTEHHHHDLDDHLRHRLRRDDRGADPNRHPRVAVYCCARPVGHRRAGGLSLPLAVAGFSEPVVHHSGAGQPSARPTSSPRWSNTSRWIGDCITFLRGAVPHYRGAGPRRSASGSSTRLLCAGMVNVHPGAAIPTTTARTCPARSGCTWGTRLASRNTAADAMRWADLHRLRAEVIRCD